MTENDKAKSADAVEASLPLMRERARDHIHLMFLVDDFQRAVSLNMTIVEATTVRFTGKLPEDVRNNLEQKLSADMLMLLEMARHMALRGKALIAQAEKVIGKIPYWDEV